MTKKDVRKLTRADIDKYIRENNFKVINDGVVQRRYFTLVSGSLVDAEGKTVCYAEAVARRSSLDRPNSDIGWAIVMSRLETALVKKHMRGGNRALHHPLYA